MNFHKIVNAISSKERWDILTKGHDSDEKLKKILLQTFRKQFELLQMDNNEKVVKYFNFITQVNNQVKSFYEFVYDQTIMSDVMHSLIQILLYCSVN